MPDYSFIARGLPPIDLASPLMQVEQIRQQRAAQAQRQQALDQSQQRLGLDQQRMGIDLNQMALGNEDRIRTQKLEVLGRALGVYAANPSAVGEEQIAALRQGIEEFMPGYGGSLSPQTAGAYALQFGAVKNTDNVGKYNPGTYTPESWSAFHQTGYSDPSVLVRAPWAPQITEVGGVPTLVQRPFPGSQNGNAVPQPGQAGVVSQPGAVPPVQRPTPAAAPLSSLENEANAKRTLEAAGATGKKEGEVLTERKLELPQAKARLAATNSKMDRLITQIDRVLADENLWQAVGIGKGLAIIPSGPGAAVAAKIKNIQSQAGLAVLQDMRDNSKTGGAVGQVSNFEQELFQNNLAPLADTNVKPEDYKQALQDVRDWATNAKQRFSDAFNETYPELSRKEAPPAALNYLRAHPEMIDAFEEKYGYRPDGY